MLAPLRCTPILKEKVWGGQALREHLHKDVPVGAAIGESWELSAHGEDVSVVAEGPLAGAPLSRLIAQNGLAYLGARAVGDVLPLLYKFIDAAERLSVQVHPTDQQAVANHWDLRGKTECWYIVHALPGTEIIAGFRPGVLPADIEAAVADNTLERLLNRFPIAAGDVLHIPAGTVHAILGGTLLYEVQETSDITLRLYDWGRVGSDGKPRALHVRESLEVLETQYHDRHCVPPLTVDSGTPGVQHRLRAACRYFALEEYLFSRTGRAAVPVRDSFQVLTVVKGDARLVWPEGEMAATLGTTTLIPASCSPVQLAAAPDTVVLVSWVPDLEADIVLPLRAAGIAEEHIVRLGGAFAFNDLVPFANLG